MKLKLKNFYFQMVLKYTINVDPFYYYTGGIIDEDERSCDPEGVLLQLWIIKNSWRDYWCEKGYARVARGKGTCGINTFVTTAVLQD